MIVDAPATGHGVGILRRRGRSPRSRASARSPTRGGTIATTIADRAFTGVVAVATAEEMPVNETLALREALARTGSSSTR